MPVVACGSLFAVPVPENLEITSGYTSPAPWKTQKITFAVTMLFLPALTKTDML
jgi:hypothetical protein